MIEYRSFGINKKYVPQFLKAVNAHDSFKNFDIKVDIRPGGAHLALVTLAHDPTKVDAFTVGLLAGQIAMETVTRIKFNIGTNQWPGETIT